MSETSGNSEDWRERLDRVEASHVKLMTDHDVFVREHVRFVREYEAQVRQSRAEADARGAAIDTRIDKLVGAIGEFMRRTKDAAYGKEGGLVRWIAM